MNLSIRQLVQDIPAAFLHRGHFGEGQEADMEPVTQKLYEQNSNLKTCTATVLECEAFERDFLIVLDQTVLFPEGGGQLSDTGFIEEAPVWHVRERNGKIQHFCKKCFSPGTRVSVKVNWQDRLDHMQQHCGEHILSHAFWKLFGANNVGFHMSERYVTIDLDKEVTWEQAYQAEDFANRQLWEDRPVTVAYKPHTELDGLPMRKKNTKLTGILRVVTVEGGDVCTCCGTHPETTGVIGIIKILRIEKHKAGTRVEFLCGRWALEDIRRKIEAVRNASNMLSIKEEDVCSGIERLETEISDLQEKVKEKTAIIQDAKVAKILREATFNRSGNKVLAAIEENFEGVAAKSLFKKLAAQTQAVAAVIYQEGARANYMIGVGPGSQVNCKEIITRANELFSGRGGGKPEAVQGSAPSTEDWRAKAELLVDYLRQL